MLDQVYSRVDPGSLSVERLSDGSTAIVDQRVWSVHSLNPSATLVWDACEGGATVAQIERTIEARSGSPADVESIHQALALLQRANLLEIGSPVPGQGIDLGRRSLLQRAAAMGAFAVPVVLTLTAAEQRAYAITASSDTTTTTTEVT